MNGVHLRKYGVQATINFELFEVDGVDFRIDAVHAAGDSAIMKNEGAEANTTNSFTDEGTGYSIVLTATEMQAARIVIYLVDQTATKVWLDKAIVIETYGNASAQHAIDLDDSVRAGLTALPNAVADGAGGLPISDAGGLDLDTKLANTNEITVARMGALTDWINGGRLDLILDIIAADTTTDIPALIAALNDVAATDIVSGGAINTTAGAVDDVTTVATTTTNTDMRGTDGANTTVPDNASIAAILVDTGTDIPALIAALNDLSAAQVNAEVDTALADYDGPTNAEMEARTPTAAELAYIVSNAADGPPVTFTGGTTTTAILGNVDGSAASSVDDFYNGRILVFNAGTLNEQVTDITDYDGATLTATITAVTTAVTAAHTANMK